jgi:hypothetical protein
VAPIAHTSNAEPATTQHHRVNRPSVLKICLRLFQEGIINSSLEASPKLRQLYHPAASAGAQKSRSSRFKLAIDLMEKEDFLILATYNFQLSAKSELAFAHAIR